MEQRERHQPHGDLRLPRRLVAHLRKKGLRTNVDKLPPSRQISNEKRQILGLRSLPHNALLVY